MNLWLYLQALRYLLLGVLIILGLLLLLFLCFLMTQLQRHIRVKFKLRIVHRLQALIMNNGCHIRLNQLLPILSVTLFALLSLDDDFTCLFGSVLVHSSLCVDLDLTLLDQFLLVTHL